RHLSVTLIILFSRFLFTLIVIVEGTQRERLPIHRPLWHYKMCAIGTSRASRGRAREAKTMMLTALGLMSGTSLDGVDVAMIETDGKRVERFGPSGYRPYTDRE